MFVLQKRWVGLGRWVGGVRHIQTSPEKRPNVRIKLLLLALSGEVREGGDLVLETAREGGTNPGLPCFFFFFFLRWIDEIIKVISQKQEHCYREHQPRGYDLQT